MTLPIPPGIVVERQAAPNLRRSSTLVMAEALAKEMGHDEANTDAGEAEDEDDVESAKHLSAEQQLEILRGKLARRNKILEVVRRAYYHDVIVVKEELRHTRHVPTFAHHASVVHSSLPPSSSRSTTSNAPSVVTSGGPPSLLRAPSDDRLSSVPSIDLRDVLPLFAPAETVLKVHPCETCGGHLELVHGESKELLAARQEMARAAKSEQQMKTVVHRMRTEAKEKEDLNDALQQRVKALVKENSYTLEQLQASRKMERDQKTLIASLRSKLQLAQTTQEDLDHVMAEYKDVKQQLIRSNHDRDIFSASNNHLKEELAEISKTLHQAKVDRAQLESDYGATYYKLQEELKKTKQLREELASERAALKEKTKLSDDLQLSLTALKNELATTMQRSDQLKRQLEDQLAEEEKAREEAQEQNLEFRRINKKLLRDLEQFQRDPLGLATSSSSPSSFDHKIHGALANSVAVGGPNSTGNPVDVKAMIRKKMEDAQCHLEQASMREHDLLGLLIRQKEVTPVNVAPTKPVPMRKKLSRMPSTTIITRFAVPKTSNTSALSSSVGAGGGSSSGVDSLSESRPTSASDGWSGGSSSQIAEGDGGEGDAIGELDEKAFEAYHEDLHRLLIEIEDGKDKSQKQQKVISDLERKNQTLLDRLEEAKLAIETLNGSVAALKARLNQDSAGAAEHLEDMMRELEEGKRDQQYENERGLILLHFLRTISNYAYEMCNNAALVVEFDLDRPLDESAMDEADSLLSPELLQRKRELRKKVLMDRAMKKFSQQCHQRAELVAIELKKMADNIEGLRLELDEAENKIDSDQLVIRNLEAENSKLQLTVEVTKANLTRTDKALKQASEELQEALRRCTIQTEDLKAVKAENEEMKSDTARLTAMLFEKTKAWEREISTNDKTIQKVAILERSVRELSAERDALTKKLQEIDDLAEWKRSTNTEVGLTAAPEMEDAEMQTDRWRPQGLILRQRNDPHRIPQRYLGKTSVTISCGPGLLDCDKPSMPSLTPLGPLGGSLNQSPRPLSPLPSPELWAERDEKACDSLEFDVYPAVKVGGRQIKTSQATTRPRNLSRLYLSSDGVSQKYIAPTHHDATGDLHQRPSTTI